MTLVYPDVTGCTAIRKTMPSDDWNAAGAITAYGGRIKGLQGPSRGSNHCSESGVLWRHSFKAYTARPRVVSGRSYMRRRTHKYRVTVWFNPRKPERKLKHFPLKRPRFPIPDRALLCSNVPRDLPLVLPIREVWSIGGTVTGGNPHYWGGGGGELCKCRFVQPPLIAGGTGHKP
jgi:hypothetical protein